MRVERGGGVGGEGREGVVGEREEGRGREVGGRGNTLRWSFRAMNEET